MPFVRGQENDRSEDGRMTDRLPVLKDDPTGLRLIDALEKCGAVSQTSLEIHDPDLPYEQWAALGNLFGRARNSVCWYIGDWLVFGERGIYGERYAQAASETGMARQTLFNYSSTCRRVPKSIRRAGVSFSIHSEVASLPPNQQRHWLARAEKEGLNREQIRDLLREERGEDPSLAVGTGGGQGRADNGISPAAEEWTAPQQSPPVRSSVDPVLAAIRAVTKHAEPLDEKRAAVRRRDLEALEAFLGDE